MPTPKQEKLAEAIIENAALDKPKSTTDVLLSVGYGVGTVEGGTSRIIESNGVQEALIKKGFTVERADEVVTEILNQGEERNRLKAADMIYERHGAKAPQKSISLNVSVDAEDFKQYDDLSQEFDEKMKRKMLE